MSAIAGALIGGASSLLGGIFGRNSAKKAQARQNEYNKPINIRRRAEEGGFNPLLWAGQGNIQAAPVQTGFMGSAIANAGLAIQGGMSEAETLKLEKTKLEQDRERLDALIEKQTIRPKSGGIYARVQETPSIKKTGAPLLTGAGQTSPVGTPIVPQWTNPSTYMADDGLERADPETPAELEADLWDQARQGTLPSFGWEVYKRNTMTDKQRDNVESVKRAAKDTYKDAKETYLDVFHRPRKKNAKLPKLTLSPYMPSISN